MTAARLAWDNGGEVGAYARSAALMYAYAGDIAGSREALDVLIHDRREPALAAWASEWRARLLAGIDSAAVLAELRRPPPPDATFREWTIAGDTTLQHVARAAGPADLRDYLEGQKNRGSSPTARALDEETEAKTMDSRIDIP